MVKLLRYSSGGKISRMRYISLWFILTGVAKETFSLEKAHGNSQLSKTELNDFIRTSTDLSATNSNSKDLKNDKVVKPAFSLKRIFRSVPVEKQKNNEPPESVSLENNKLETIQKSAIHPKNTVIYPYYRPGRAKPSSHSKDGEIGSTVHELQNYDSDLKRHDTVIPMVRFGRTTKSNEGKYDSVIPYPRFGRSIGQQATKILDGRLITEEIPFVTDHEELDQNNDYFEEIEDCDDDCQAQKRGLDDMETIIPYPRPGRESFEDGEASELLKKRFSESKMDYILPQMRYGRSMLLLSPPKAKEPTIPQTPKTFVLPYPRPGRSVLGENNDGIYNDEILRYHSSSVRSGLSSLDMLPEVDDEDDMYINGESFLGLKVNPLYFKGEEKNLSGKPKDKGESSSVFIIPYPRPGKKSMLNIIKEKQQPSNSVKYIAEYVVTYPRPGKKSTKEFLNKIKDNSNKNQNTQSKVFVLPYPRPGRSSKYFLEENSKNNKGIANSEDDNINVPEIFSEKTAFQIENKLISYGLLDGDFSVKSDPGSEVYDENLKNEHIMQYNKDNDDFNSDEASTYKKLISEMDYFGLENSMPDNLRFKRSPLEKRSNSILPYPRFGKSVSVVPYPRLGRAVVPYPRPGRSDSVIPYPRFGRSNSVVPYPRIGKSYEENLKLDRLEATVPYLKAARSNAIVPYPRPGRSEAIVPYPRPGRSKAVVPYPRPGRSEAIVPYPRPGRSLSVVPYPRLGRSGAVVPYPRPGRSEAIVPYPRPGRSNAVVPYPRPGRANAVVPYPRPGRSNAIVPYPRPGRSSSVVPYPRPGRSNLMIPYPRQGKSLSVVSYPRLEKSSSEKTTPKIGKWLLPNVRPGRSEPKNDDAYVVPYPRPGRSEDEFNDFMLMNPKSFRRKKQQGYVLPHPRIGRSELDRRGVINGETVIPYPRLGRSEKELTPSPNVMNSVHKMNKHMLNSAENSVYLLPYPRPGRYAE